MLRPCGGCDAFDTSPRHVTGLVNAEPGTTPPPDWHPACHAREGCALCAQQIKEQDNG